MKDLRRKTPTTDQSLWRRVKDFLISPKFFYSVGGGLSILAGVLLYHYDWLRKIFAEEYLGPAIGAAFTIGVLLHRAIAQEEAVKEETRAHDNDRFAKAIDQLGATLTGDKPNIEVRLGGLYTMENLAKIDEGKRYHNEVLSILTAYVRQNTKEAPEDIIKAMNEDAPSLREDTQTALAIIERRISREDEPRIDFGKVDLQRADLSYTNLSSVNLTGANLTGANLENANLRFAILENANLQFAKLYNANLQFAKLQDANLGSADLRDADFVDAKLQGASLRFSDLRGADLRFSKTRYAQLLLLSLTGNHPWPESVEEWTEEQLQEAFVDENTVFPQHILGGGTKTRQELEDAEFQYFPADEDDDDANDYPWDEIW